MNANPKVRAHNLEAVADFVRGGGPPTPDHEADLQSRKSRVEAERKRLFEWAAQNGAFCDLQKVQGVFGGEHRVYYIEANHRFLKETRWDVAFGYGASLGRFCYGASPSEYLDRLDLQNRIFGDDIQLVGIVDHCANPVIVTSQPAIVGVHANRTAIDEMMSGKGFEKLGGDIYYDGKGLLISDVNPPNVIQVVTGGVHPIDLAIQRITEEFTDFIMGDQCARRDQRAMLVGPPRFSMKQAELSGLSPLGAVSGGGSLVH